MKSSLNDALTASLLVLGWWDYWKIWKERFLFERWQHFTCTYGLLLWCLVIMPKKYILFESSRFEACECGTTFCREALSGSVIKTVLPKVGWLHYFWPGGCNGMGRKEYRYNWSENYWSNKSLWFCPWHYPWRFRNWHWQVRNFTWSLSHSYIRSLVTIKKYLYIRLLVMHLCIEWHDNVKSENLQLMLLLKIWFCLIATIRSIYVERIPKPYSFFLEIPSGIPQILSSNFRSAFPNSGIQRITKIKMVKAL